MAAGSPPESTARRASSKTGSGGHQINSFSFLRVGPLSWVRPNFRWRGSVGEKGTRNLRHELSSRATTGLTAWDWGLEPSRDNKSEGVAFGMDGDGGASRLEHNGIAGKDDDDDVTENERNSANPKETVGCLIGIQEPASPTHGHLGWFCFPRFLLSFFE